MLQNPESLRDEVLQWLENRGYPLEMRVAHALRNRGRAFYVEQSRYYPDPTSGELRESDVVANWTSTDTEKSDGRAIYFSAVIECKSGGAPWIIFTETEKPDRNTSLHFLLSLLWAGVDRWKYREEFSRWDTHISPVMAGRHPAGYGITQKRNERGARDGAYDAVRQVAAAAYGVLNDRQSFHNGFGPGIGIVMPVIVTDSPLFECYVNYAGDVEARSVTQSALSLRMPYESASNCYIRIINVHALDDAIFNLRTMAEQIVEVDIPAAE
ncbi:hypothetical protein [Planotetraspora mira]|uniref:Uncharacterized protein n=1 Tax=Planotetraspora mira TaxID=58121 RepID=A0A8J3TVW8_9ACTN|nr:hypothetical protein [Planotetraspora mira]GII32307.1 hypothetical protein Pmi06nite_57490 [Planotetraspora mira]